MVATYIAATAVSLAAATGVSVAFATFAISFALSMVVSRVFGQDQQGPQDNGTREQVPPSNVNAVPIVYGDAYLGGTFVDAVITTDQKTMYYVLAVSCISPNGQFSFDTTKMYYGDRLITFDGTDATKVVSLTDEAGNVDTKISGNLYINLYKSTAAGTITPINGSAAPSSVMGGADIDAALRWPSSGRQMNGLAFAIIKLNYNQDAGTTNLSPVTFYAKHYLYSTGVAKPGDVWYDYITNPQYGGAVNSDFVDANSATALNAYSDELIPYHLIGPFTSEQPRYRMNGVLDAGQTVLSNLDKIMTCSDSWMAYNAAKGQWSVVVNKADTVSYAFNDDNIIGEVRVSATDITQSINIIEAKFPDKGARDQPNFVNIATPSILRYPNEPDNKYSVTYDLCNDSVQAQYLANRILEQAREDLIVGFSTSYYGIQVDAGTVVSVTNADYGWTNKLFRVVKVNEASLPDGSLGAKLEMSEYSEAVYDNFDITEYAPVPNSGLPSAIYFSPLSAPVVTASNPTSVIPNFNVSVAIPAVGRVTRAELFYTTSAIPTSADWRLLSSASTIDGIPVAPSSTYVFSNQVLPTGASSTATYYFSYVVGNEDATSPRSPISASFTWTPVAGTGPTGPTGSAGPTGPTGSGEIGISALTAYRVQSQSAADPSTPSNTSGPTAPSGWSLTAPSVSVGNVLWYSFGQYNANAFTLEGVPANQTQWGTPTAASVFQDIRSDNWNGSNPPVSGSPATWGTAGYYIERTSGSTYLNNLYARGTLQSGTTPAVSGTTMTGSGGVINSTGTFAFGNSVTNISFNGTQMTLNGNVVATGNINLNAVTVPISAFTSGQFINSAATTWQDAQTITVSSSGNRIFVSSCGNILTGNGTNLNGDPVVTYPSFRLVRDSTVLLNSDLPAMSFSDQPSSGTYIYKLQVYSPFTFTVIQYAGVSNRSLLTIETKR